MYLIFELLYGCYDVNIYVIYLWIVFEELMNVVMFLNFRKIYFFVVFEVWCIENENCDVYVRSEVVIIFNGKVISDL